MNWWARSGTRENKAASRPLSSTTSGQSLGSDCDQVQRGDSINHNDWDIIKQTKSRPDMNAARPESLRQNIINRNVRVISEDVFSLLSFYFSPIFFISSSQCEISSQKGFKATLKQVLTTLVGKYHFVWPSSPLLNPKSWAPDFDLQESFVVYVRHEFFMWPNDCET